MTNNTYINNENKFLNEDENDDDDEHDSAIEIRNISLDNSSNYRSTDIDDLNVVQLSQEKSSKNSFDISEQNQCEISNHLRISQSSYSLININKSNSIEQDKTNNSEEKQSHLFNLDLKLRVFNSLNFFIISS